MPPMRLAGCLLAAACGRSASRTMRPFSGGDALDSAMGEGEAGGAAHAASRGAARGRGASRCRMRRRAPFPLMSPPQSPASRASRCSKQREARMADLRFVVFAARRKPPQRAGVVPPGPEATACPRATENESRPRGAGRVHRLGERHECLRLLRGKPAQKPYDECQIRSVQRGCALFCAALMLDRRFTRDIL